jgi:hypothetical protein
VENLGQRLVLSPSEFEAEAANVRTVRVVESSESRNVRERDRLGNLGIEGKIMFNRIQ